MYPTRYMIVNFFQRPKGAFVVGKTVIRNLLQIPVQYFLPSEFILPVHNSTTSQRWLLVSYHS